MLGLVGLAGQANAEATPATRDEARVAYQAAEQAEDALDFRAALMSYERALSLDPSASFSRVARARAQDLRAHNEGDFVPLARLEAVRRKPNAERPEIEALDKDANGFAAGRVRAEAKLVVAEAYWHRFNDQAAATAALRTVVEDEAADKLTRSLGLHELVAIERERGDLQAAYREVSRFPDLVPALYTEISRLLRRVLLTRLSFGLLGLCGLIGLVSLVRARRLLQKDPEGTLRRIVRPVSVGFALYIGGAAALLVRYHGDGDVRPFLWLGFGALAVNIVAHLWRLSSKDTRRVAKLGRALVCALGVLAVAFLSLERANAGYLESFGL